jgi:hypothetical protein
LELGTVYNIENIQGNIIKVAGKYHFCQDNGYLSQKIDHDENLLSGIYSGAVSYPLNKNIIGCVNYDVCYFLTDKGLYSIDFSNNIEKCDKNTKEKKLKELQVTGRVVMNFINFGK